MMCFRVDCFCSRLQRSCRLIFFMFEGVIIQEYMVFENDFLLLGSHVLRWKLFLTNDALEFGWSRQESA